MLFKKLPVLVLVVVASGLSGQSELYHFKEDGTLTISGHQYLMGVFTVGDTEASEIADITSGVQYRWSLSHNPRCLFLERESNKSSVLTFSRVDFDTFLVIVQDIHTSGLPAPRFKVLVSKRCEPSYAQL